MEASTSVTFYYNNKPFTFHCELSGDNLYNLNRAQGLETNSTTHDLWLENPPGDDILIEPSLKIYVLKEGDRLFSASKVINNS